MQRPPPRLRMPCRAMTHKGAGSSHPSHGLPPPPFAEGTVLYTVGDVYEITATEQVYKDNAYVTVKVRSFSMSAPVEINGAHAGAHLAGDFISKIKGLAILAMGAAGRRSPTSRISGSDTRAAARVPVLGQNKAGKAKSLLFTDKVPEGPDRKPGLRSAPGARAPGQQHGTIPCHAMPTGKAGPRPKAGAPAVICFV